MPQPKNASAGPQHCLVHVYRRVCGNEFRSEHQFVNVALAKKYMQRSFSFPECFKVNVWRVVATDFHDSGFCEATSVLLLSECRKEVPN